MCRLMVPVDGLRFVSFWPLGVRSYPTYQLSELIVTTSFVALKLNSRNFSESLLGPEYSIPFPLSKKNSNLCEAVVEVFVGALILRSQIIDQSEPHAAVAARQVISPKIKFLCISVESTTSAWPLENRRSLFARVVCMTLSPSDSAIIFLKILARMPVNLA